MDEEIINNYINLSNSLSNNKNEIPKEEIEKFIKEIKTAFIKAVDSIKEEEFDIEKLVIEEKEFLKNNKIEKYNEELLNNKELIINLNHINKTIPIVEIINGKLKINIPKDKTTRKLWKFLRYAMNQKINDNKKKEVEENDILGVSKYEDDYEGFFNSLIKK